MDDMDCINEQFNEIIELGYSVKEAINMLRKDENVNQEVLEKMLRD